MPKPPEYSDLFTNRKSSVFPENVQKAARDLGISFQRRVVSAELVLAYRSSLRTLPANSVPRGAYEIREIAEMNLSFNQNKPVWFFWRFLQALGLGPMNEAQLLRKYPDLGWLLMFHGNGHLRQLAMEALVTSPRCPFEFVAVVYRLNDWVGNVRSASTGYAGNFLRPRVQKLLAKVLSFCFLR